MRWTMGWDAETVMSGLWEGDINVQIARQTLLDLIWWAVSSIFCHDASFNSTQSVLNLRAPVIQSPWSYSFLFQVWSTSPYPNSVLSSCAASPISPSSGQSTCFCLGHHQSSRSNRLPQARHAQRHAMRCPWGPDQGRVAEMCPLCWGIWHLFGSRENSWSWRNTWWVITLPFYGIQPDVCLVFVVFKARVDMAAFRQLADLAATHSKPLLRQSVYVS